MPDVRWEEVPARHAGLGVPPVLGSPPRLGAGHFADEGRRQHSLCLAPVVEHCRRVNDCLQAKESDPDKPFDLLPLTSGSRVNDKNRNKFNIKIRYLISMTPELSLPRHG